MRRAIRLAMNGRGQVEPNPMVGCVIVKNGRMIGEGFHARFGGPHAEPTALAACDESPEGATAYVTLEPCCHTNKKTPPCVPALTHARIARVVIGSLDPNPAVNGNGAAELREAGLAVDGPLMEPEAKQLIAPFIAWTGHGCRPYVTLKWAQSADGKVAGAGGSRRQITGPASQQLVHELRSRADAIVVGINTVLCDDPLLNARHAARPRHPARFVLDRDLRTPLDAAVVSDDSASTTIFCGHNTTGAFRHRRDALQERGVTVTPVPADASGRLSLPHVLRHIRDAGGREVLVEPGPTLADAFLADDLADRVWVFESALRIDDATAPAAPSLWSTRRSDPTRRPDPMGPDVLFTQTGSTNIGGDVLSEHLNAKGPLFFAAAPSADFVLAASS